MALSFTLFLSGSPQDYEWLPQTDNHAKQVCEKYFNLPSTETPHSSDFYVELFPLDKYSYYTYLHRKSVNGMPREGAHIALTMRISGGYCNQPKSIYELLEMVYMQYIDGKITQRKGDGEIYLIQSLMGCEDQRKQMESALAQALQLVTGSLLPFGNEISTSRQPSSVKYFTADSDNEQLLNELRKTHKLKLIPSFDNHAEKTAAHNNAIEQLQQQIEQKDNTIKQKNKEIDQLNSQLKELKTTIPQKKANPPYEDLRNVLTQLSEIKQQLNLIAHTENPRKNPETKSDKNENDVITRSGGSNNHTTKKLNRYLPWGLFVAALVFIIVNGILGKNSNQIDKLQNKNYELEKTISNLKSSLKEKENEIKKLNRELDDKNAAFRDITQRINTTTPTESATTQKKPNINVGGKNDTKFYAGKTYPLSVIHYNDNNYTFEITRNDNGALAITADGQKLYCSKKGSGTITAYDQYGEEIVKRTITVEQAPTN